MTTQIQTIYPDEKNTSIYVKVEVHSDYYRAFVYKNGECVYKSVPYFERFATQYTDAIHTAEELIKLEAQE